MEVKSSFFFCLLLFLWQLPSWYHFDNQQLNDIKRLVLGNADVFLNANFNTHSCGQSKNVIRNMRYNKNAHHDKWFGDA